MATPHQYPHLIPVAATFRWSRGVAIMIILACVWMLPIGPGWAAQMQSSQGGRPVIIDADLVADGPNRVKVHASVDVRASADRIWEAIMDFDARRRENWLVDAVKIYADERSGARRSCSVRWELGVLGIDVVYHTRYALDRSRGVLVWQLDDAYQNDLQYAHGEYRVVPAAEPGYVRVEYTFEVGSSHVAPLWVRRKLTRRGVDTLLTSIRDASEVAGSLR